MARYTGPKCKQCRREGMSLCGKKNCAFIRRPYPPGEHGRSRRRRPSDYAIQLREKQKVKRLYGVLERQFRLYFKEAARRRAVTGEALLMQLECRLDNVVYRMGFGHTRAHARQLVKHGHMTVNGSRLDIPSAQVKQGDVVAVRQKSHKNPEIALAAEAARAGYTVGWVEVDLNNYTGTVVRLPMREDIDIEIQEQLIIELYSK